MRHKAGLMGMPGMMDSCLRRNDRKTGMTGEWEDKLQGCRSLEWLGFGVLEEAMAQMWSGFYTGVGTCA
jgi:hypothetical protein